MSNILWVMIAILLSSCTEVHVTVTDSVIVIEAEAAVKGIDEESENPAVPGKINHIPAH